MSAFRRDFYKTKCMTFLYKMKNCKKIKIIMKFGKKVCNIIKKEFAITPVYNEQYLKYLKTKIKVYDKKNQQISVAKKYQRKIHNIFAY